MKNPIRINLHRILHLLIMITSFIPIFSLTTFGQGENNDSKKESINLVIKNLMNKSPTKRQESVKEIYNLGKDAIPALIEFIDDETGVPFILVNPKNSFLTRSQLVNSLGLTSAYLIELILGRDSFSIKEEDNDFFIFGNSSNYIYWEGIIVNSRNEVIKTSDLSKVKIQYKEWWSKSSNKSIERLRKEWTEGKKPLAQSNYKWR